MCVHSRVALCAGRDGCEPSASPIASSPNDPSWIKIHLSLEARASSELHTHANTLFNTTTRDIFRDERKSRYSSHNPVSAQHTGMSASLEELADSRRLSSPRWNPAFRWLSIARGQTYDNVTKIWCYRAIKRKYSNHEKVNALRGVDVKEVNVW